MTCVVCALDPAQLAEANAALVEMSTADVATVLGFSTNTMAQHLGHSPVVKAARAEYRRPVRRPPRPPDAPRIGRPPKNAPKPPAKVPTGEAKGRNHTRMPNLRTLTLEQQAWDLRIAGNTYPMIATALGLKLASGDYDYKAAHRLITRAMERFGRLTQSAILEHREVELVRLESLEAAFRRRALQGVVIVLGANGPTTYSVSTEQQDRAALVLLQVSKERRKLLGLDVGARREREGAVGALGGMGPNALPPSLALMDPPPTLQEVEHYVITGEIPRRGGAPTSEQSYITDGAPRLPLARPAAVAPIIDVVPEPTTAPAPASRPRRGDVARPATSPTLASPPSAPARWANPPVSAASAGPAPKDESPPLPAPAAFPWARKAGS